MAPAVDDSRYLPGRRERPEESEGIKLERECRGMVAEPLQAANTVPDATGKHIFYLAHQQSDGTYSVTLTEAGIETFEIALGIAHDLSSKSPISPESTVADIMDRTATREELAGLLRRGGEGLLYHIRTLVLERKLRGSEKPSVRQTTIGRLGKTLIVAIIGLWALKQFAMAIQDIEDIPGILAGLPGDIVNLHPTSAFDQVGNRISDAYWHTLVGVLGACLTYVVASVIHPFGKIYRKDQLLPGERIALRLLNGLLRRLDKRLSGVT